MRKEPRPHGTRAKYVGDKCRCEKCRGANRAYYHARMKKVREVIETSLDAVKNKKRNHRVERTWKPKDEHFFRHFKHACPGVKGKPCRKKRYLRKDSTGGLCGDCRNQLAKRELASSRASKLHLDFLYLHGVGLKTVSSASGVGESILRDLRSGVQKQLLPETEKRILAVTETAYSGGTLRPSRATWHKIRRIREMTGWSKAELAFRLGRQTGAIQIKHGRVTAKTELAVAKLFRIEHRRFDQDPGQSIGMVKRMLADLLLQEGETKKKLAEKLGWKNLDLHEFKPFRVTTLVFQDVKELWERETGSYEGADSALFGNQTDGQRRLAFLRRMLPCTVREVKEAFSVYTGSESADRMLYRDLRSLGALPVFEEGHRMDGIWSVPVGGDEKGRTSPHVVPKEESHEEEAEEEAGPLAQEGLRHPGHGPERPGLLDRARGPG